MAEKITLPWCKPLSETLVYEPRVAKVGDTVVFDWEGEAHNAWIYPSGECLDNIGREYLGEQPGSTLYTFLPEDVGTKQTFVCSVSNHCIKGQILVYSVVGANDKVAEYDLSTPCGGEGYLGDPPSVEEEITISVATSTFWSTGIAIVAMLGAILVL
eukprot:CAMPEP_0116149976 /NCGR_PEP_ID=MMETSP0329-20121206/19273_1 /TAXON_ID=697910 /ORGANISM="Pseudo-nitzschia arenysensis, Strain B593" /LENGTH=156 /DNA_ID=CAMNT_0003646403 /DNA_START=300 /DNA_END=770 /DNA_ORIENTATION=+